MLNPPKQKKPLITYTHNTDVKIDSSTKTVIRNLGNDQIDYNGNKVNLIKHSIEYYHENNALISHFWVDDNFRVIRSEFKNDTFPITMILSNRENAIADFDKSEILNPSLIPLNSPIENKQNSTTFSIKST